MRVPAQSLPEVSPQAIPSGPQRIAVSPDAFGGQIAQAEGRMGATLEQAADRLSQNALQFQQIQNETTVNDIYSNKFSPGVRSILYDPQSGFYAKQGKDAIDGIGPATKAIEDLRQKTRASLNPMQQRMFDDISRRRAELELDGMASHADQENKKWRAKTSDDFVADQVNDAATNYNNDQRFDLAVKSGLFEIKDFGRQTGQSDEMVDHRSRAFLSEAWARRVERMAILDPVGAQDLYRQNMDKIDGAQHSVLEEKLKSAVAPVLSRNMATAIMGGHAMPDVDALTSAVIERESGGDQSAVSGKGAIGTMQVMPDTARDVAKELGVPFDPARLSSDADYNKALGKRFLQDMLQRYGGNQTLALAAYNAGPANVDKWIAQNGDPNKNQISNADFLAKIPFQETQDYVSSINAKVPLSSGTAATAADVRAHLADWLKQADSAADMARPGDPVFADLVKSHLLTYAHQVETGQAQQEKNSRDLLLTSTLGLVQKPDGGFSQMPMGQRPSSLDQLLTSPQAKNAWATMDPIGQRGILELLDHNAKGTSPPVTDEALSTYYRLKGEAARDPIAFGQERLDDPKLLALLPHHLTLDLMNAQAALTTKQAKDAAKGENLTHAAAITKPMLMSAGIAIPTKPGEKAAVYDQFIGRLSQGLDDFQTENKRTAKDDEIRQIARSLLVTGAQAGTGWIFGDKSVRAFQVDPSQFYTPVPSSEEPKIIAQYKATHGVDPTKAQIREIYTYAQLRGQQKPTPAESAAGGR